MLPPRILQSIILCIFLLIQFVSADQQSHNRILSQQPQTASNGGAEASATPSNQNPAIHRTSGSLAREFLLAHNKVRTKFKHPHLQWDRKLARQARRWGFQRVADCKMAHSYGPYGENLFWGARDHWTPTEAVNSWAKEEAHYDAARNACLQGRMCGHYTQIVWKDSLRLGCARIKCLTGGVLLICEYDPPGNFIDESPFNPSGGGNSTPAASVNPAPAVPSPP